MFSGGPSLAARLANIQHMPVLIAATMASDKPADGYLVKDIIKMSYESPQTRAFLQQYLLNQLITSRNVYVKRKVLKLIEELLEKGHIEFKQNLRKQPEPLNEASRLRAHNKDGGLMAECGRIRDLANKVLEMLYSDTPELQKNRYPSPEYAGNHSSQGETSSSGTRMEGFGNTPHTGGRASSSSTTDKLKALFGSSTRAPSANPVYDKGYATMDPVPHNVGGGGWGGYSGSSHAPGRHLGGDMPAGAPHRMGEAGGGWGAEDSPSYSPALPRALPQEEKPTQDVEDFQETSTEQEKKLVDDITAPGGVKAAPPRESLNKFISRCKALDCLAIVEFLQQKLQEENSQVVLKALFVIEALLRSDVPDVFTFLDLSLGELNTLTQSQNATIRAKATKILHLLSAEASHQATSSNTGSNPTSDSGSGVTSSTSTILDLGVGGEGKGRMEGTKEEEEEELVEQVPPDMAGLFSGMSVTGQAASPRQGAARTAVVKPTRPPAKKATPSKQGKGQAEVKREEAPSFDVLLGLSSETHSPPRQQAVDEEVSLMDMGEDKDEFDPLKRAGSTSKSSSLTRSASLDNLKATPTATPTSPPGVPDSVMSQLSGLDLSISQSQGHHPQGGVQTDTSELLLPLQLGPSLVPMATNSSSGPPLSGPAPQPMVAMTSGNVAYMPAMMPYAMQPRPGLGQQGMPVYTAAPAMMYMNQPRIGGEARPVQRPMAEDAVTPESGFDFLGRSSKGSAFDFVKEEMDIAKKK